MVYFPKRKKPKPWLGPGLMREAKARADARRQGLVHITPGERGSLIVQENKRRATPLENARERAPHLEKLQEALKEQKLEYIRARVDILSMEENDDPDKKNSGRVKLA